MAQQGLAWGIRKTLSMAETRGAISQRAAFSLSFSLSTPANAGRNSCEVIE